MLERSKLAVVPSSGSRAIRIVSAKVAAATQILTNLQRFDLANREIDDDAVGVEALGLNASFKTTRSHGGAERSFGGQFSLEIFDQDLILSDDEHFGHRFVFQIAQRHAVLFEKLN